MLGTLIRKNLMARPLRYVLTGLSIMFGVAAVTAVFIFTGGLRDTFSELSGNIEAGYDIAVRADSPFGDNLARPEVPIDVLDQIASVEGVRAVQPRIIEFGVVAIDADDEPRVANGPNIGLNWEERTPNPRLFVQDGVQPTRPAEFAIDLDGFEDGNFAIGENYQVLTPTGSIEMELVGTFNFAAEDQNAAAGAVLIAFAEEYALNILNGDEGFDDLTVILDDASATEQVLPEIEALLANRDDTLVAEDQATLVEETQDGFDQILGIFQTILLVFAVIILIVSAFLIFNVFTITLGQRIKELGLLRSIGAFGSQVTSMMMGEALLLGVLATVVGIPAGWGLALLLRSGLSQLGFPGDTGLPIRPTTILYAVLVGVVVTLLAALFPSLRARRVTPMTALRDGGLDETARIEPDPTVGAVLIVAGSALIGFAFLWGAWLGLLLLPVIGATLIFSGVRLLGPGLGQIAGPVLLAIGLALLTVVRFSDLDVAPTFGLLGAGALVTLFGAGLVSGLIAGPVSRLLGWFFPLGLIVGILGIAAGAGAVVLVARGVIDLARGRTEGAISIASVAISLAIFVGLVWLARWLIARFRSMRLTSTFIARYGVGALGVLAWILAVLAGIGVLGGAGAGLATAISDDAYLGAIPFAVLIAAPIAYGLVRTSRGSVGLTGRLARDNAARNPQRTATTATALMIGLALVSGVTVIGDSIKTSVSDALGNSISADWFIQGPQSGPQGLPFSAEALELVDALPEIEQVEPYNFAFGGFVTLQGADVDAVQSALPQIFAAIGSEDPEQINAIVAELGADKIDIVDALGANFDGSLDHIEPRFVERDSSVPNDRAIWLEDDGAADAGLAVGDSLPVIFLDGQVEELTVAGIYEDGFVFGERVIDFSLWEKHLPSDTYGFMSATTAPGVDAEVARTAINEALAEGYPLLEVRDSTEVQQNAEDQVNQTLAVVNILLMLAAGIAILGIAIALSLAVFERTREIGLLRAVGTTRQQTRWMVRWEGVIVAAFGGIIGVLLGIGLGVLATQKMPEFLVTTTSIPVPQLLLYVVLAALTGLGAGAFPALIAGRMNVLDAISND